MVGKIFLNPFDTFKKKANKPSHKPAVIKYNHPIPKK